MLQRNITIPKHVRKGIGHRKSGFPDRVRFFAGDCETCEGEPITIQLAESDKEADLLWISSKTILPAFLGWMRKRLLKKQVNVCYFHNLNFDLVALLYDYKDRFTESKFSFEAEGVEIEVLAGKLYYAKIKWPDGTILHLVDSFRFYTTSLKKIGKALKCANVKREAPAGLGKKRFTVKDKDFIEYAKQDAMLGYEVARHIVFMHEEFDVPLSISAPQFAARVFQKYYLKEGDRIELPNRRVIQASVSAYHGGKNGFYVKPGLYRDVSEIDISSAYPHAMSNLPQFLKGRYGTVTEYKKGFAGMYCVTGLMKKCRYPVFLYHNGKPVVGPCEVKRLWVTSYELEEALSRKEFISSKVFGWIWIPDEKETRNPLVDYVKHFYRLKEESGKEHPMYHTYKLCLNSLYGKFMQNIEEESHVAAHWILKEDGTKTKVEKTYRAGGLFQPFIGSLITGAVRAYLHRLEHEYKAIHASTDSIKTRYSINPASLPHGLGGLNLEVRGDCIMLRNKLYLHYEGEMNGVPPKKYALHGFWGKVEQLKEMIEKRENKYIVEHLYRVNEARIQGLVALKSYLKEREIEIAWEAFQDDVPGISGRNAPHESGIEPLHEKFWLQGEGDGADGGEGAAAQGANIGG